MSARWAAEFVGTAFLLLAIVGANLAAESFGTTPALGLLIAAVATGGMLAVAIAAFQPASGAHFNPAVTIAEALVGRLPRREIPAYVLAQVLGGITGVVLANAVFTEQMWVLATIERSGGALLLGEALSTFGLTGLIVVLVRSGRMTMVAASVGAYVAAIHFIVPSTGFANPTVSLARVGAIGPAGIEATSALAFVAAQVAMGLAVGLAARRMG